MLSCSASGVKNGLIARFFLLKQRVIVPDFYQKKTGYGFITQRQHAEQGKENSQMAMITDSLNWGNARMSTSVTCSTVVELL